MPVICPASKPLVVPVVTASGTKLIRRATESPVLGIVVCERSGSPPFAEASFIRRLIRDGAKLGLDVFAFSPSTWDEAQDSVLAWTWRGGWIREARPAPSLAYDRAWPRDGAAYERHRTSMNRMRASGRLRLLNSKLPGKAAVLRALLRAPELRRWLPPTALYRGEASLTAWLDRCGGAAFLKPSSGSQGRRVIVLSRDSGMSGIVTVRGRTSSNRSYRLIGQPESEAIARIHRWIGNRTYLMQPALELQGLDGEPFDLRILMQRDGEGRWARTGLAARRGRSGAVTTNLHGGGEARNAQQYLTDLFGEREADSLLAELQDAADAVLIRIEESFGPFAELGLDFGIDRTGQCWFLEANSKPGRASMACAGEAAAAEAAERPLAYARHILLRSPWEGIS
ncbi:YheC/YheD family protein [Cohnella lubricantis]|uniref:YheC/YheD family protein n=1 Tax=Cohnella lubricantis TaxID=2163172 RepID=A0A841T9D8_9BACL|nr:YheC/YheD family protein [Cohnella lubricantis]MBB6677562.1 YheC/YheD family protein [Cohnella lubricantis]MBP2116552.1 hypothetical protein [Cohnella lubricantis]